MTTTNPPRWKICWRFGLVFSIAILLLAGSSYAYGAWMRSVRTAYLLQCRQARDAGDWVELQRLAERWTAWDRRNTDAWLFRADAAQHQDDFASAAVYLESIPDSDPKSLPVLVSLSKLQFAALNRPFDGVKTCERMLMKEPRTTAAHEQLIEFYALSLQRRQLEYQIRFAIKCSREPPTAYVYLFLIDTMKLESGVASNSSWLEQYPDSEIFSVARVLQMPEPENDLNGESGDHKSEMTNSLFEKFPKSLELLAYKIDLSIRRGDPDKVMELLLNLPPEADEDSRFWRAKGWLHLVRDELPKAKEALQKAIELYPMDWNARNWLSDALRSEGDFAEAERHQGIVRRARRLRQLITSGTKNQNSSTEVLTEIAEIARQCGDVQVAQALTRRLGLNGPSLADRSF